MNNSIFKDVKQVFSSSNYLYQLIIVNAIVFVGLNIVIALTPSSVSETIKSFFSLSANVSENYWMIWTYFTYMFTHTGLFHFAFNMLWLYWLGMILADLYGQKRVLELYIYGGLAGGILYIIASFLLPTVSSNSYLIGASAGVMSVMIAIGILQPNYRLRLIVFGEVPLKYIVLVGFLSSSVLDLNLNTGGKLAHFGGAIFGAIFAYYLPKGIDINQPITKCFQAIFTLFSSKPKIKVVHKNKRYQNASTPTKQDQAQVDVILDKISKSGYDSLSKSEKDFLFKFGK